MYGTVNRVICETCCGMGFFGKEECEICEGNGMIDELQVTQEEIEALLKPEGVEATLEERGKRYGEFDGHAFVTQSLKRVMRFDKGWDKLTNSQKESLEIIAHKIGRILNGDPNYADSWHDIAGYALLVGKELLR